MAGQQYIGTARLGTHQSVAYTGTAGTITNGISANTLKIRVVLTSAGYILIGDGTAAQTSDVYMAADSPEYFSCTPGQKVSAIRLTASGTLHVTECS